MISLTEIPQRSDMKIQYETQGDILVVKIDDISETFDFRWLEDGLAEEIIVETLPVNPIVRAEKIGDVVNVTVIRFYSADEKVLFEVVDNG